MTRYELTALAKEAGMGFVFPGGPKAHEVDFLEHFANMVAAKEREACKTTCDIIYDQFVGPELGEVRFGIAACKTAIDGRSR